MFLDYHPAKQLALPGNIDKTKLGHNYSKNEMVTQSELNHISEGIIANLGTHMTERLAVWSAARRLDAENFLSRNSGGAVARQKRLQKQALMAAMETVYINLKRLQCAFNSFARGTDLHVTDCPIDEVEEPLQVNKFGELEKSASFIRTRFSTRLTTLAIRGSMNTIECFIYPTSLVMALSVAEDQFVPLATVQLKSENGQLLWKSADCQVPLQDPEEFAMWLFDNLIEQSKMANEPSHRTRKHEDTGERGYISENFAYHSEPKPTKLVLKKGCSDNTEVGNKASNMQPSSPIVEFIPFDYKKAWG
jgi:hypothetical protein